MLDDREYFHRVESSIERASEFLRSRQQGDGHWCAELVQTAWAVEGLLAGGATMSPRAGGRSAGGSRR